MGKLIVGCSSGGIISVDINSPVQLLISQTECLLPYVMSSANSILYAACYNGAGIVSVSSYFSCFPGYSWQFGLCSPAVPGYYKSNSWL